MAVISAEGGIFDTLNRRYTNGVNIDIIRSDFHVQPYAGQPIAEPSPRGLGHPHLKKAVYHQR